MKLKKDSDPALATSGREGTAAQDRTYTYTARLSLEQKCFSFPSSLYTFGISTRYIARVRVHRGERAGLHSDVFIHLFIVCYQFVCRARCASPTH